MTKLPPLRARASNIIGGAGSTSRWFAAPTGRGFKAGALAVGLARATGEFIAVFDADFVPPRDFLKKTIPHFHAQPNLGLVQTRWGHLNDDYSPLTRAEALALDGHFVVEQTRASSQRLVLQF